MARGERPNFSVGELTINETLLTATAAELNTLDLSAVGAEIKVKKIPIAFGDGVSENKMGWDLPSTAIVLDVLLNISVVEATGATKTIDIGTDGAGSNDPDGFADAVSVAAAGLVRPGVALDGTSNWYAANTRGVLLSMYVAGTNADDRGLYSEMPDLTSGGEEISWTPGSNDFAELAADLLVVYIELA